MDSVYWFNIYFVYCRYNYRLYQPDFETESDQSGYRFSIYIEKTGFIDLLYIYYRIWNILNRNR